MACTQTTSRRGRGHAAQRSAHVRVEHAQVCIRRHRARNQLRKQLESTSKTGAWLRVTGVRLQAPGNKRRARPTPPAFSLVMLDYDINIIPVRVKTQLQ